MVAKISELTRFWFFVASLTDYYSLLFHFLVQNGASFDAYLHPQSHVVFCCSSRLSLSALSTSFASIVAEFFVGLCVREIECMQLPVCGRFLFIPRTAIDGWVRLWMVC